MLNKEIIKIDLVFFYTWSVQVPPLSQGVEAHSFVLTSQFVPVIPAVQLQVYPLT